MTTVRKPPMTLISLPMLAALCCATAQVLAEPAAPQRPLEADRVTLGRYLVKTTGCNDCHTAGYAANAGHVPESGWLTGDALGWHGPWGTTYPSNLRLRFADMSEQQWLDYARHAEPRPPMPWFNLRAMSDGDLKAIYQYIRAAGPAGAPAPAALPPGQKPPQPYVQYPQQLPQ